MNISAELAYEVQEVLSRYVKGEIDLDVLQHALDELVPRVAEFPDDYAARAVDHVDVLIAELLHSHRTEDELRQIIRDELLLPSVVVHSASAASNATQTVTSNSVLELVA